MIDQAFHSDRPHRWVEVNQLEGESNGHSNVVALRRSEDHPECFELYINGDRVFIPFDDAAELIKPILHYMGDQADPEKSWIGDMLNKVRK